MLARFLTVLITLSVFSVPLSESPAENVKVFLLAGHSNIAGTAEIDDLTPQWNVPQDDVWIWLDHNIDGVGDWVALGPGHGNATHNIRPEEPEGITPWHDGRLKIGPELSLGRTLADAFPDDRIALIKHADGGGLISDWNTANPGPPGSFEHRWSGLLQKTSSAFEALETAGHSYEIEGFFWSLGGRDARNWAIPDSSDADEIAAGHEAALARSSVYGEGLTNFIDGVRDEFGANLPFVIARIADDEFIIPRLLEAFPGAPLVREAQLEVAASDPFTTAFAVNGLSTGDDELHFDAAGQIEQGIRFANAYLDLISMLPSGVPGDYNGNGTVAQADLDLVLLHWGADASTPPSGWTNELPEGTIDQNELDGVLLNWGNTNGELTSSAAVPEPSAMMLLLVAIAVLSVNQRRRRI